MTDTAAPFQPLSDRLAGIPVDDTLHEGVPAWLDRPLHQWLYRALYHEESFARRVALRLRWTPPPKVSYLTELATCPTDRLLTAVDAVLQLHPGWDWRGESWGGRPQPGNADWMAGILVDLELILVDAGSLYTVDWDNHCLARRVDATVTKAFTGTVQVADPTAGDHLRTAWGAAYGLHPDPDRAYDEAVLAVEAVACPLVCPNNTRRTLGTVIRDLRNQAAQWELAIGDSAGQPAAITRLVEMLALLWEGQSRHAGAPNSRRQNQAEAEGAVHLAATVVQWLATGVLRRKP